MARIDLGAVERNCAAPRAASSGRRRALRGGQGRRLRARRRAERARAALRGGATRLAVAAAGEAEELRAALPRGADPGDGRADGRGARTRRSARAPRSRSGARASASSARALAGELGAPPRVHVKHDSGMGGWASAIPRRSSSWPRVRRGRRGSELAGVWTHFATADERRRPFLDEQLDAFAPVAERVASDAPGSARPRRQQRRDPARARARTSTWSAAASPSTASTRSDATRATTASSRRWSCAPTSPT